MSCSPAACRQICRRWICLVPHCRCHITVLLDTHSVHVCVCACSIALLLHHQTVMPSTLPSEKQRLHREVLTSKPQSIGLPKLTLHIHGFPGSALFGPDYYKHTCATSAMSFSWHCKAFSCRLRTAVLAPVSPRLVGNASDQRDGKSAPVSR